MIDLGERRFAKMPEDQRLWLEQQLGKTFGIEDFRALSERSDLTSLQRSIVVGMKHTLSGEMMASKGRAYTKEGTVGLNEVRARSFTVASTPTGETELQKKVRTELESSLRGHEDQLDAFVELARRWESGAWLTPPIMAVVGRAGHGKDEAIEQYAKIVLGEEAKVEYVDLSRYGGAGVVTGMSAGMAGAFGQNGALSLETLKKYEPEYAAPPPKKEGDPVEEVHPRIVVLRGVKDLRTKNSDAAQALADILGAPKGSPNHVRVQFIFDFEEPVGTPPRKLMIDSVAEIGSRYTCSSAEFKDLSGDTLAQYADPILKDSLALYGTGNTVLTIDEDADAVLKRALATPYDPLGELHARLYEWLISRFDTQTSVDRETAVLRVSLNPKYALDKNALDEMINQLHQQYADTKIGADLFVVNIVGKQVDGDPEIDIALGRGTELAKTLRVVPFELTLGMPLVEEAATDQLAGLLGSLRELGDSLDDVLIVAKKQNELAREEVLPEYEAQELYAAIEKAERALFTLDDDVLADVPPDWLVGVKAGAESWLRAARIIADKLWGVEEQKAEEAQG